MNKVAAHYTDDILPYTKNTVNRQSGVTDLLHISSAWWNLPVHRGSCCRTEKDCVWVHVCCVCVCVHEVKVLRQAKAMFYNTNARWTTLEEEEAAARCPTEHTCTHWHTQPSPREGGRVRGGRINTQLIDRTNSVCKCFSSCWHSGAFCWGSQKLNERWQIWLHGVVEIWDSCWSKDLKVTSF